MAYCSCSCSVTAIADRPNEVYSAPRGSSPLNQGMELLVMQMPVHA